MSQSKAESCVQPRRAVSLWSDNHNDSLKYDSQTYDQKVNMAHYVRSIY